LKSIPPPFSAASVPGLIPTMVIWVPSGSVMSELVVPDADATMVLLAAIVSFC